MIYLGNHSHRLEVSATGQALLFDLQTVAPPRSVFAPPSLRYTPLGRTRELAKLEKWVSEIELRGIPSDAGCGIAWKQVPASLMTRPVGT